MDAAEEERKQQLKQNGGVQNYALMSIEKKILLALNINMSGTQKVANDIILIKYDIENR